MPHIQLILLSTDLVAIRCSWLKLSITKLQQLPRNNFVPNFHILLSFVGTSLRKHKTQQNWIDYSSFFSDGQLNKVLVFLRFRVIWQLLLIDVHVNLNSKLNLFIGYDWKLCSGNRRIIKVNLQRNSIVKRDLFQSNIINTAKLHFL